MSNHTQTTICKGIERGNNSSSSSSGIEERCATGCRGRQKLEAGGEGGNWCRRIDGQEGRGLANVSRQNGGWGEKPEGAATATVGVRGPCEAAAANNSNSNK